MVISQQTHEGLKITVSSITKYSIFFFYIKSNTFIQIFSSFYKIFGTLWKYIYTPDFCCRRAQNSQYFCLQPLKKVMLLLLLLVTINDTLYSLIYLKMQFLGVNEEYNAS